LSIFILGKSATSSGRSYAGSADTNEECFPVWPTAELNTAPQVK